MSVLGPWTFAQPWAFAFLALPVLLILLSLQRRQAIDVPLGTARWFAARSVTSESKSRRRLSPARIAAVVALLAGTLALAAPERGAEADDGEALLVLVDRSPSMFLPADPALPKGPRRIDVAVDELRRWMKERRRVGGAEVRLLWTEASVSDPLLAARDVPGELLAPPARPAAEPAWPAHDRAGLVWLTDRAPENRPQRAGLFASGGGRVPGLVALDTDGGWSTVREPGAPLALDPGVPRPSLRIDADVPPAVRELAEIWAEARGVALSNGTDAILRIRAERSGSSLVTARVARDRWSGVVAVPEGLGSIPVGRPWLTVTSGSLVGRALVSIAVGEVRLHVSNLTPDAGAEPDFAVSWAALFDEAKRPSPGVVSVREREGAGARERRAPRPVPLASFGGELRPGSGPSGPAAGGDGTSGMDALDRLSARSAYEATRAARVALSLAAAALGCLALILRARGSA